ncbi:MAG TPA: hypothetical protein VGY54_15780 [Polyangiaceae bacterium]|jgi:hypothetical protein|nr:hypothetical protein [Polyangiaceae bacterium]
MDVVRATKPRHILIAAAIPVATLAAMSLHVACGSSSPQSGGVEGGADALAAFPDATGAGDGGANGLGAPPDGASDSMACPCALHGRWKLDNLSPCFFNADGGSDGAVQGAVSSATSGNMVTCPMDLGMAPSVPWSTDTFTTDCAGHFTLCYALKAGDGKNPQPSDCVFAHVCAESDYATASQPQMWPALPGWITATEAEAACARAFSTGGGYGEMTLTGTPAGCAPVSKTLGRFTYCPLMCNATPNAPECAGCLQAQTGTF